MMLSVCTQKPKYFASLLALAGGIFLTTPLIAHAATATLNYARVNNSISMGTTVTMSSGFSYWSGNQYNCNGGGATRQITVGLGPFFGPGTYSTPADKWGDFLNLPNGTYTLYAIASGQTTSSIPYTPWYASTGDTTLSIP
jgi:hypothetical protein